MAFCDILADEDNPVAGHARMSDQSPSKSANLRVLIHRRDKVLAVMDQFACDADIVACIDTGLKGVKHIRFPTILGWPAAVNAQGLKQPRIILVVSPEMVSPRSAVGPR